MTISQFWRTRAHIMTVRLRRQVNPNSMWQHRLTRPLHTAYGNSQTKLSLNYFKRGSTLNLNGFSVKIFFYIRYCSPVARIDFGGVRDPQKVDFFEPHPLTLLQKPHFWPNLWLKGDLLADLGGCVAPPAPPLATGLRY